MNMASQRTHHEVIKPRYEAAEDDYPPRGTPEACLALVMNCEVFTVLGHTGRYFHGQCNCAGVDGEEIGIDQVPDVPGYWVMEGGTVCGGGQRHDGDWDDAIVSGNWRPATQEDFEHFSVDCPAGLVPLAKDVQEVDPLLNGSKPDIVKRWQHFHVEGYKGGSFIELSADPEHEEKVTIAVGSSCVYTWNRELITVEGLALLLTCLKDYGTLRFLRERGIEEEALARMFPSASATDLQS